MVKLVKTPRDRLDRLIDYTRKARRYWWVVAIAIVLGGAMSVVFAVTRPPTYKSWSLLFYQEKIQSQLLTGREATEQQRNIGERYRELLLSRDLLSQVVKNPELNAFKAEIDKEGIDAAVEELRRVVALEIRGQNAFRISYTDVKPGRAQAVAAKLTELLTKKEESIRSDQVQATAKFAEDQKKLATEELGKRQTELSGFLAKHPEFAQEDAGGSGAGIRARSKRKPDTTSGNPRLTTLERQRSRIKARLEAPPGAVVQPRPTTLASSPAVLAAQAAVAEARRELVSAQRDLETARGRFTDRHPDVTKAQGLVAAAEQRLREAQAAVPKDPDADKVAVAPTTAEDRQRLERQLDQLDSEIAAERRRDKSAPAAPSGPDDAVTGVVQLETEFARLRDSVDEQRDRVESLSEGVFRAQMDAQKQLSEQGAQLTVVDPAFRPAKPIGQGKRVVVMAGLALFLALGLALALGCAILDDRLYRRSEVEELGLAPVLAVIPPIVRGKQKRRRR